MARKKQGSNLMFYTRMSSQGLSPKAVSMDDQKEAIARRCASEGWQMVAEQDDPQVEE